MNPSRQLLVILLICGVAEAQAAPTQIDLGDFGPGAVTIDFDELPCASGLPTLPGATLSAPNGSNGLAGPDSTPPAGCQTWGPTSSPGRFSLFFNGLTIDFDERQQNVGFVFGGNQENSVSVDVIRDGSPTGNFNIISSTGAPDGVTNWIFYGFQDIEGIDAIQFGQSTFVVGIFDLTSEFLPSAFEYVSGSSGNWDDGANWNVGTAPIPGSDVIIAPDHGLNVFGPADATTLDSLSIGARRSGVAQLFLSGLGELTILGNLQVGSRGKVYLANVLEVQGTVGNDGTLELASPATAQLVGGSIKNNGVVSGSGVIGSEFANNPDGRVRVLDGQTLTFTSAGNANRGAIQVLGGTAAFTEGLNNDRRALVAGRGLFDFGAGLDNDGNFALNGNSTVLGDVTMNPGSRVVVTGGASATFFDDVEHNGEAFQISEGSQAVFLGEVSGAGPFTGKGIAFFEGDLIPGNSAARITFEGDVVLSAAGSLFVEIGGLLAGDEYDQLQIQGDTIIGGDLSVDLIDDFLLDHGQEFIIIDSIGNSEGRFADLSEGAQVGNFGGFDLFISYLGNDGNDVVLFTGPAGLAGDTNGDGLVNIDDLNNVRNNFGAMGPGDGTLGGDAFPFDGLVNIDDLNAVRNNFGAGVEPVPEPSTLLLALAAAALAWTASRRHYGAWRNSWRTRDPNRTWRSLKILPLDV